MYVKLPPRERENQKDNKEIWYGLWLLDDECIYVYKVTIKRKKELKRLTKKFSAY